ncbi:hypersensitive response-inducing protein [Ilyonectria robusta]
MKFFTAAILSAVAVSASPVAVAADAVFTVSDFSAGCIPHSTQCLYSFGVLQPGTMETTPVKCEALVTANTDGTLPNVKHGKCKESSRLFSVTRGDKGLYLKVWQPVTPSSNQSGKHLLPKKDLVTSNKPNAVVQSYKGPKKFSLY